MGEYTKADARKGLLATIKRHKDWGATHIEILTAQDELVCEYCEKNAGVYPIDEVPILPHDGCTAPPLTKKTEGKYWCRCCYCPVIDEPSTELADKSETAGKGCLTALIGASLLKYFWRYRT